MADAQAKLDEAKAYAEQKAQEAVDAIDNSDLATKDELAAEADAIRDQLSTRGGANLLKNSIGYAGSDYWTFSPNALSVETVMNEGLATLGFGSGFYFPNSTTSSNIQQTVNVVSGETYTLSWFLQKTVAGNFTIDVLQGTSIIASTADISTVGGGYTSNFVSFTPTSNTVTVRFTSAASTEATLTGVMLGIGNLPVQWTLATGELYNAYVRADERGLLVLGLDENGLVERRTVMSPTEFAGYYDANRDGEFERVFWLTEDETVSKKFRAVDEITMGSVKIVNIQSTTNKGWAFVPVIPQ